MKEILYVALPYVALALLVIGGIYRFTNRQFSYSSVSSQFLEGNLLFWGIQPFHWGVVILFFGHLTAWICPSSVLSWNTDPARLFALEMTAFIAAVMMLVGLVTLLIRRLSSAKICIVTTPMDYAVILLLIAQVILGILVATLYSSGSSWFAAVMAPYLTSIFTLSPQTDGIASLPVIIQLHVVTSFIIVGLIPFSRLAHLLVFPLPYLWRPTQLVVWYRDRATTRDPESEIIAVKPVNN